MRVTHSLLKPELVLAKQQVYLNESLLCLRVSIFLFGLYFVPLNYVFAVQVCVPIVNPT